MITRPYSDTMSPIPLDEIAPSFEHRRDDVGEVVLHSVVGGPPDGDLVVLLHGLPQFWYTWRHQLEPLADAGFRVIAPDLRGYNESDRPTATSAYRMDALLDDVEGLIDAQSRRSGTVVGHDWGGGIGWELAMTRPSLVDDLCIVNAPHPAAFKRELAHVTQIEKSWYALFVQLPKLPEMAMSHNDFEIFDRLYRDDPKASAHFSETDIERYKSIFRQPGAVTAALNYYRAYVPRYLSRIVRESIPGLTTEVPMTTTIEVPTQVIWGMDDVALVPELSDGLQQWVPDLRVERLPGVSHWVPEEMPNRVTHILVDFLHET